MTAKTSVCEICDATIDLSVPGWQESDTGGDICAACIAEASKGDEYNEVDPMASGATFT